METTKINKKLISVRINKELLDKIEEIKKIENRKKTKIEFTKDKKVYYFGRPTSTAWVIEQALKFYFENVHRL